MPIAMDLPPQTPGQAVSYYAQPAPEECKVTLEEILKQKPVGKAREGELRDEAVLEESFAAGAQRGLQERSRKIYRLMEAMAGDLDQMFNFRMLMYGKIMPPVITEARETFVQDADGQSARASQTTWEILVPAKIMAAPPSWRDYLQVYMPEPAEVDPVFLPKSSRERDAWERSYCDGYMSGYNQADLTFKENLNRLTRDYLGMIRFRVLAAQNIVSEPVLEEGRLGVTAKGKRLFVDDRVYKITVQPDWEAPSKWKTHSTE
jgi:defect-in-organelle-trafficking protein DotC